MTLLVWAQNNLNDSISTPFVLSINPNFPPQVKQAISTQTATVGLAFDFALPVNAFEDSNGDQLSYVAFLAGGARLPGWLTFIEDGKGSWHFKGTPNGWDTDLFSDKTMTIQITAYNIDNASATTWFNLNINGTSTLRQIVTVGSLVLSIFGLFQKRAAILNRLCYKRYQKSPHAIEVGQPFSLSLSTPRSSVGNIEVKTRHIPSKGCGRFIDCQRFFKPPLNYIQLPYDPLEDGLALPKWMEYKKSKNTLEGVLPLDVGYRELIVRVTNRSGIVQEQVTLKIEGASLDRDDEENPTSVRSDSIRKSTKASHNSLALQGVADDDNPEVGYARMPG